MTCCRNVPKIWPRFFAFSPLLDEQSMCALCVDPDMDSPVPVSCTAGLEWHLSRLQPAVIPDRTK